MAEPASTDQVNRLLEMVVEEVSLVDRAANKHRFLIVKRSDGMDDTTNEGTGTETDLNATAPEGADGAEGASEGADTGADEGGADAGAAEGHGTLAAAVAALEGLTEAVELLTAQEDEVVGSRLAELAEELQAAAETLAAAAGAAGGVATATAAGAAAAQPNGAAPAGAAPATPATGASAPLGAGTDRLTAALTAIHGALQQVGAALAPPSPSPGQGPGPVAKAAPASGGGGGKAPAGRPGGAAGGGAAGGAAGGSPAEIAGQLAQVVSALQALTATVKQQQQRLARLEKRSGVPNSQPAGERAGSGGTAAASWPLDLNRPVDRESVAKAVSFHDL